MTPDEREAALEARLERVKALEEEIKRREKAVKKAESARKQIVLRLSPTLWDEIAAWAEADFRSINGQIEYRLTETKKKRRQK